MISLLLIANYNKSQSRFSFIYSSDHIKNGYCFNGGTYSHSHRRCHCREHFTGNHCEIGKRCCQEPTAHDIFEIQIQAVWYE